jgi:hypothetical protein
VTDATERELHQFLESLGSGQADEAGQAQLFHDGFLNVDPKGVGVVSRAQLEAALPMRTRLFASIGATGTRLIDVTVIELDEAHALARGTWDVEGPSEPLQLRSSFLLRRATEGWEVLVYLNHQDIVEIVRERTRHTAG